MVSAIIIGYILISLFAAVISLWISYAVMRSAVRAALFDHYKIVRWFELTGEWRTNPESYKKAPRDVALAGTDEESGTRCRPQSESDEFRDYYS